MVIITNQDHPDLHVKNVYHPLGFRILIRVNSLDMVNMNPWMKLTDFSAAIREKLNLRLCEVESSSHQMTIIKAIISLYLVHRSGGYIISLTVQAYFLTRCLRVRTKQKHSLALRSSCIAIDKAVC